MRKVNKTLPDNNIIKSMDLTASEKLILMFIKFHVGMNEYATVGQQCLATETRLSRATVNKCTQAIDRKGWMTVTKRRHPKNGYVCHEYRLVSEKYQLGNASKSTVTVSSDDITLCDELTKVCITNLHKDIIVKIDKTKIKEKVFASKPATASTPLKNQDPIGNKEDITSLPIKTSTPSNVSELEHIWKTRNAEKYSGNGFVADLTSKQRGQLKNFIMRLGNNDPIKIFDGILSNWIDYTEFVVKSGVGIPWKNMPDAPSIPFTVLHISQAVNFMNHLEEMAAEEKATLEAREEYEKLAAIEKAAKEAALLEARKNMTEEEKNIKKYKFHYDKIRKNEMIKSLNEPLSPDIGNSDYDPDIIMKERCDKAFAQLLSEGSVNRHAKMTHL